MRSIDVLQVVTSTDRRGAETIAVELGPALVARGLETETVALTAGTAENGFQIPVLGTRAISWSTLLALRARARTARVVVAHGSRTLPACALALVGTRVPFVYRNIGDPSQWATTPLQMLRTGAFLHRARAVVALTDRAAAEIHRKYRLADRKISVIPSGVSAERHRPADGGARRAARDTLGLPEDALVLTTVGALRPEKGMELAIGAVAELPDVHLVIAGDGPLRAQLEAQTATEAPGRVHFTGTLADPDVAYAAADLVLLTSHTEGLPGVLIEAGLRGLPSVTTDVGFVRDIVVDGETGVVVTAGDPEAIRDGVRRARQLTSSVGAAAQVRCRALFELRPVADQWSALLATVIAT